MTGWLRRLSSVGMSHRTLSQRMATWLMVALLALVVGEPLRAHDCPTRAHLLDAASAPAPAGDGHQGHHAGHQGHGADAPAPASGEHAGDHGCECVGDCSTAAPVAAPYALAVRTSTALVAAPAPCAGAPLAAVPAGEHVLPFAIGPPARG